MEDVRASETGSGAWEAALHDFFIDSFEPETLRRWVTQHYRVLAAWLPDRPASLHEVSSRFIDQASREGYIDNNFFRCLLATFARKASTVERIHTQWARHRRTSAHLDVRLKQAAELSITYQVYKYRSLRTSKARALLVLDVCNLSVEVDIFDLLVGPKVHACESASKELPVCRVRIAPLETKIAHIAPRQRARLEFELVREGDRPCDLSIDFELGCDQPFDLFVEPGQVWPTYDRSNFMGLSHP